MICLLPLTLCISSSFCLADNSVQSLLGVPFGQICTIKAEFIDKPNDYYAQNMSRAEYYLKIIEIDGKVLPEPLIAEPVYENGKYEKEKVYTLKAYETINSEGEPVDWSDVAQQFNYSIRNKVVIKPLNDSP
jgi:hypothetical protein